MEQLLNHRFNSELPTVIVVSTPIEQLDDRIRTRLTDPKLSQIYVIEEKLPPLLEYTWGPGFKLQKSMTFENFDWRRLNLLPEQQENLDIGSVLFSGADAGTLHAVYRRSGEASLQRTFRRWDDLSYGCKA